MDTTGFMPSIEAVFPGWNPGATPRSGQGRDEETANDLLASLSYQDAEADVLGFETEDNDVEGCLELLIQSLVTVFFEQREMAKYSESVRSLVTEF